MKLDDLILVNHLISYNDLTPQILLDILEQGIDQNANIKDDSSFNVLFQLLIKCLIKHDSMNDYLQTINNSALSKLEKIYDILLEIFISSRKHAASSSISSDTEILLDFAEGVKSFAAEDGNKLIDLSGMANIQARSLSKYLYNIILAKYAPSIPKLNFLIHCSPSFDCLSSAKYLAAALSGSFNSEKITFTLKMDDFLNNDVPTETVDADSFNKWAATNWPHSYDASWDTEQFGKYSDGADLNTLSSRCIGGVSDLIKYYDHIPIPNDKRNSNDEELNILLVMTHGPLISNYLNNYSNALLLESSKKKGNGALKNKYNNMKVLPSSFVFLQNCTTYEKSVQNKSENDSWILEYSNINFQCFKKRLFLLHDDRNQQSKNLNFYNYAKIVEFSKFKLIPKDLYDLDNPYLDVNKSSSDINISSKNVNNNNNNNNNNYSNNCHISINTNGHILRSQIQAPPRFDLSHYNTSVSSLDSDDDGMENSTSRRSRDRRNTILTTTTSMSHVTSHEDNSSLRKNPSNSNLLLSGSVSNSGIFSPGDNISGYDFSQNYFKFDSINDDDPRSDSSKVNQILNDDPYYYYDKNSGFDLDDQIVASKKDARNLENISYLSKISNKCFTNLHLAANNTGSWSGLDPFGAPRVCVLSKDGVWAKKDRHGKFILHVDNVDSIKSDHHNGDTAGDTVKFYFPDDDSDNTKIEPSDSFENKQNKITDVTKSLPTSESNIKDTKKHPPVIPTIDTSVPLRFSTNNNVPKAFTPIARTFKNLDQQAERNASAFDSEPMNDNDDDVFNELYGANVNNDNSYVPSSSYSVGDLTSLVSPTNDNNIMNEIAESSNVTSSQIANPKNSPQNPQDLSNINAKSQGRARFETISLPIMDSDNIVNSALTEIQSNFDFFRKLKKESKIDENGKTHNGDNYNELSKDFTRNDVDKSDSNVSVSETADKYFVQKDNVFYFNQQKPTYKKSRNKDHKLNEMISDEDNDGELILGEGDDDASESGVPISSMKAFDERSTHFNSDQSNDFFASLNKTGVNSDEQDVKLVKIMENASAITNTQKTLFRKFDYMPPMSHPIPAAHGMKGTNELIIKKQLNDSQLPNIQRSSTQAKPSSMEDNMKLFYGTSTLPSSTRYNDLMHNTSEENKIIFVSNSNETSRYDIY